MQTAYLEKVWPLVLPLCQKACDEDLRGTLSPTSILEELFQAKQQLWLAWDGKEVKGACGTAIEVRGDRKVFCIRWLGGSDFKHWQHLLDPMKAWAKELNCTSVEYFGRKGWERVRPQSSIAATIFKEAI